MSPEVQSRSRIFGLNLPDVVTVLLATTLFVVGVVVGHLSSSDFLRALVIVAVSVLAVALANGLTHRNNLDQAAENIDKRVDASVKAMTDSITVVVGEIRSASLEALMASPDKAAKDIPASLSIISAERAASIESKSGEMWIWAYDLRWDSESPEIKNALLQNLAERRSYRYLIPREDIVLSRMEDIISKLRGIDDLKDVLEVRIRPAEVAFARFGLTLYNPSFKRPMHPNRHSAAVLFPHFKGVQNNSTHMILFEGSIGKEYEGEFDEIWKISEVFDIGTVLAQGN